MPDFSAVARLPQPLKLSPPWSWAGHIPFAMWLVQQCKPPRIVELGSHSGHSYFSFCQSARQFSPGTTCYAVDTWSGDHQTGFYGEEIFKDVAQHNERLYSDFSTLLRMTFDEALNRFSDHSIDLLHIDGLHTYEAVKHDFETWLPKMSARGVVLFHDIAVQRDDFGVWKFWREISLCYPHLSFDHSFGLGVLVVGDQADQTMRELTALCEDQTRHSLVTGLFAETGKATELQTEIAIKDRHIEAQIAMIIERDTIIAERDTMITERIAVITERDAVIKEQNAVIAEHKSAIIERDHIIAERDSVISERDEMIAELTHKLRCIISSPSWRMTKPFRKVSHSYRKRWNDIRDNWFLRFEQPDTSKKRNSDTKNYEEWIALFDAHDEEQLKIIKAEVSMMKKPPLISVLMPVYNPHPDFLNEAISSVCNQIYPHWELCIADDCSTDPKVKALIQQWALKDKRIRYIFRKENGHISAASNSALEIATGNYIALLDHDDLIHPLALYWNAREIINHPECALIYSDEDKIDGSGLRSGPYFKSDFNYDLLLCHNMISHLGIYKSALMKQIGGFREGFEGSQDYDLALRAIEHIRPEQIRHIPRVLYHWRIHEMSTAMSIDAKPYALAAAAKAVREHLERQQINAIVTEAPDVPIFQRIIYTIPDPPPSVDILVHHHGDIVRTGHCINTILHTTTYTNYSLTIIDHGSKDDDALSSLQQLNGKRRINIIRHNVPGGYSKFSNRAAKASSADYLCLFNSNIEVVAPEWLMEMVGHAMQKGVGAVGAKLLCASNTLLHGGMIMGIGYVAGYAHKHLNNGEPGYIGRGCLQQSFSALAGGCILVNRKTYRKVGGLNKKELEQELCEIDFCLKLAAKGLRNVWTPYAVLRRYQSPSRNRAVRLPNLEKEKQKMREISYMQRTWKEFIQHDPAYNPNLSITSEDFSYACPPRINTEPFQLNHEKI
jgi:O-antigen biosynthesis protein